MKKQWKGAAALFAGMFLCCGAFALSDGMRPIGAAAAGPWDTPAAVIRVTEENIGDLIDHRADGETEITDNDGTYKAKRETYAPADRQWQGLANIAVTGDRMWACWYTGGSGEPRLFNYVVLAYSDDGGETWVDPFAVVDATTQAQENAGVVQVVCNLFVDEEGELYLTYMQSKTWAVKIENADATDIEDVTFSTPYILTEAKLHKQPTIITDGDGKTAWAIAYDSVSGSSDVSHTAVAVSKDHGATWETRGRVQGSAPAARKYPESQVAQTRDGRLILVSRLEGGQAGGIEVARSDDYGATWTPYENNLTAPFIGPGSKGHIMALSSGNLLVINHDTTSSRGYLTAYLSTDDGKTFPHRLLLDGRDGNVRTGCSYPAAFEKDGKIYAIWDFGRYVQKEIRFSLFTEEDVVAGEFLSEGARYKEIVSKLNPDYKEIVELKADISPRMSFQVGTTSAQVREQLPSSFTVVDNEGTEYALEGQWRAPGYNQEEAGVYLFRFEPYALPITVEDCRDLFVVRVELTAKNDRNNAGFRIGIGEGAAVLAGGGIAAGVLIHKQKKGKRS